VICEKVRKLYIAYKLRHIPLTGSGTFAASEAISSGRRSNAVGAGILFESRVSAVSNRYYLEVDIVMKEGALGSYLFVVGRHRYREILLSDKLLGPCEQ
jgi:hypothetical protein